MRVFHFLSKEHGLEALQKQRLKVATINELNDPFELLAPDLSNKEERRQFLDWKNDVANEQGFLCFSLEKGNPLLWSHYANKHQGMALELEVADEYALPVQYRHSRVQLNVASIMKSGGFSAGLAEQLVSTKYIGWAYEEEVRVAVKFEDCEEENGMFFESLGEWAEIVNVHAGPLCELNASELERSLPAGTQLTLHYTRIAFRSFNVVSNQAKRSAKILGEG